jgi:hypothetical protein
LDNKNAVSDGLAGDGDDLRACEDLGLFLRAQTGGQTNQGRAT